MKNVLEYLTNKYNLNIDNQKEIIDIKDVIRKDLADWIHELDVKTGVEVGVADGGYSEVLCNVNPQMELIGVDPWLPYADYDDYKKQSTFNALEKEARKKLSKFPNYKFMKEMSMDAVKKFKDELLDFVYIDANHQCPYVMQDITEWSKKIKVGGIVSGHDFVYITDRNWGVKHSVLEYIREHNIKPVFVLGEDASPPGAKRELHRSWLFIKK